MRRFVVPLWTSIVITLAGIWSVVVPFLGLNFGGASVSMAHSMSVTQSTSMTPMFLGIAISTYVYHIIPGGVVVLVGLYQLILGLRRESAPTTEQRTKEAQAMP
jgi:hypothetical protein